MAVCSLQGPLQLLATHLCDCMCERGFCGGGTLGQTGKKDCFNHQHLFSHAVFHSVGPLAQSIETCAKKQYKNKSYSEAFRISYSLLFSVFCCSRSGWSGKPQWNKTSTAAEILIRSKCVGVASLPFIWKIHRWTHTLLDPPKAAKKKS